MASGGGFHPVGYQHNSVPAVGGGSAAAAAKYAPPPHHRRRRRRRDVSEVSCCLKYVIFGFNVIFWLLGLSILAVGVWAWTEKNAFHNISMLTNVTLDPAFLFICGGAITFIIGKILLVTNLIMYLLQ